MGRKIEAAAESDSLHAYLRAIGELPRLTPEEERELGRRIRAHGDQDALRRLVEANLRFVVSYAKRYRGLGVSFLDLIHEGNLGLMEAVRRFDPARNVKFITYAVWWIRQALMHALSTQSRPFSLPAKISGVAARFGRDVSALAEHLDRTPTSREIANDLEISEGDVDALLQISGAQHSLSDRFGGGSEAQGSELGDLLEQQTVPPADETFIQHAISDQVRAALGELDDKEAAVMRLRFGLDGDGEAKTLQEIGKTLNLSRERIRQIESRAKDKLRRSKRASDLRSYLN